MSEEDSLQTDAIPAAVIIPPRSSVADRSVSQKLKLTNISTSPNSLSNGAKARSYFVLPISKESVPRPASFFRIPKTSPTPTVSPFSQQSDSLSETNSIKSVKSIKSTVSFKIENVEKLNKDKSMSDIFIDDISDYGGSVDAQSLKSEDFEENEDVFIMNDIQNPKKCRIKERSAFRRVDSSDSIPPPNDYKHHVHIPRGHKSDDVEPYNNISEPTDDSNDKIVITVEGK